MLTSIKSIALEQGSAKLTITTFDIEAIAALMPLIGTPLKVTFELAQLPLPTPPMDGQHVFDRVVRP